MAAFIYGLASTRNGIIRYVGESAQDYGIRARQHYRGWNSVACVQRWSDQERWCGYDIYSLKLMDCDFDNRFQVEADWIKRVPNLLNVRKNYENVINFRTKVDKYIIRTKQKINRPKFIENFNGYIGIRHYTDIKAWRVHLQAYGYRHHWLTNTDREPVWRFIGENLFLYAGYFAQLEEAIEARDLARRTYYRDSRWPPDKNVLNEDACSNNNPS